jgi:serine protease Do
MIWRAAASVLLAIAAGVPAAAQATRKNPLLQLSGAVRELTRRVSPAVVEINVTAYSTADDQDHPGVKTISRQHSSGSGVVIDPSGYIVTNAHVVEGAITVKVLLGNPGSTETSPSGDHASSRALQARIVGLDRDSDLALIRVEAQNLPVLHFADSDEVRQGDLALAIGSPMGLHNSVSLGVVSAPARSVNDENPILYIQTDASINPGNSGGALVDMTGALIGLNTFIVSQSGGNEGIGFAIPSNVVRNVSDQLRRKGKVSRGSVGMYVQNITAPMAKGLSLPIEHGVVVSDVQPDGPADKAGIKRRDVLISLNGKPLDAVREFEEMIYRREAGDKIAFVVQRGDSRVSVNVEVKEQSTPWDPLADLVSPEKNLVPRLGILCIELDQQLSDLLPDLRRQYGLIVAAKSPQGQGQWIDLQPGDIIHAVNNLPMASLATFQEQIEQFHRGDAVALQIERDGHFQFVAFEME